MAIAELAADATNEGDEALVMDTSPQAFEEEDSADGLDSLDDLMAESMALKRKPKDDLEALLDESMELKAEDTHIKMLREKAKRGGISTKERLEDEARIREWEARREWDIKANVGVFEVRACSCGNVETIYSHLMHFRQHKEKKIVSQVRATEQIAALPNMIAKQHVEVECCNKCAGLKGWDLAGEVNFTWSF